MRDAQAGAAVLVVDADTRERSAVRAMLAPLGYRIAGAESQADALRAVAHERFAVIVHGHARESLDGYETAKRIREETGTELTPIIFLTAFGDDELETAAAYASGAVDFVFTPVLAAVLRAKVSTFMKLVMRSQQLEDSVESIMRAQQRAGRQRGARASGSGERGGGDRHRHRGGRDRVGQPVGPAPVRLRRRGGDDREPFASVVGESTGRRKDGSTFPMELGMSRMQIDGRTFTIGSVHDITGRSQRFERDRVAFEEAPIGSVITSRDGRIERVNQAVCEMTGRTSEQLIGRRLSELAHPADRPASAAALAALVNDATGTRRFEGRYLRHGGQVIEASVAVSAIRDDHGGHPALHPDRGRHRRAPHDPRARAGAVRDARAPGRGGRAARRRHRSAHAPRRRAVGRHRRAPGPARLGAELVPLAAVLHDVGKIAIPDAVLSKRGKLTAKEFDLVKTHTTVGGEMLKRQHVRPRRDGGGDRADAPREMGRQRLPGRPERRRDPDHRPDRRRRRRPRRPHPRAALQTGVGGRGRGGGSAEPGGKALRPAGGGRVLQRPPRAPLGTRRRASRPRAERRRSGRVRGEHRPRRGRGLLRRRARARARRLDAVCEGVRRARDAAARDARRRGRGRGLHRARLARRGARCDCRSAALARGRAAALRGHGAGPERRVDRAGAARGSCGSQTRTATRCRSSRRRTLRGAKTSARRATPGGARHRPLLRS